MDVVNEGLLYSVKAENFILNMPGTILKIVNRVLSNMKMAISYKHQVARLGPFCSSFQIRVL